MDEVFETRNPSPVPALRYALFLSYQNKMVRNLHTKKWGRVLYSINNYQWDKAHVIVKYFNGQINEGTYDNVDDLKVALMAFREPQLLEYINAK